MSMYKTILWLFLSKFGHERRTAARKAKTGAKDGGVTRERQKEKTA